MPGRRARMSAVLGGTVLLAFLLRTVGLDIQGYWYDEGSSVFLARQGLAQIVLGKFDHPPLYHLLLALWVRLVGTAEFATRYFSVCWGVLVVLLGGALIRLLIGRRAAALAALLLAVSPVEVWYAQEARMYALVSALSLGSSVCLVRVMQGRGGKHLWALYAFANVAAVYTHYCAVLALLAQSAWVLLHVLQQRNLRLVRPWIAAHAALALALLPWLPVALMYRRAAASTYWPGRLTWQYVVREAALGFAGADLTISERAAVPLCVATGVLVGLGILAALVREQSRWGALLLVAYVVVPFLAFYVFAQNRPKFSPRYLLVTVPALLGLAGAGVAMVWPRVARRWHEAARVGLAAVLVGSVAAASAYASTNTWRDSAYGRDDLRGAARFLAGAVGPEESLILLSGHFAPAFALYCHQEDWFPIPPAMTPAPSVEDVLTLDVLDAVNLAVQGKQGVWLLLWQHEVVDPNGVVLALFDLLGTRQPVAEQFRGLELRHYSLPAGLRLTADMFGRTPLNVAVGQEELELVSCDLPAGPVPSGETATLLLHWRALRRTARDYRLELQLLDGQGQLLATRGGRVAGWMYPTYRWQPGRLITARQDVCLPPGLPPGEYLLQARVFALGEQSVLTVPLGRLVVSRALHQPTLAELGIVRPLEATLAEIELLGCQIAPAEASPGQAVQVTLIWRARARPAQRYSVALSLGDQGWARLPLPDSADMAPGDVLRVTHTLLVPAGAADGSHRVSAALEDQAARPVAAPVAVGELGVRAGERLFAVPAEIGSPLRIDLGAQVTFLGHNLDRAVLRPGYSLHLDLYWQCVRPMETSYTVFVHLLDDHEKIWGQVDCIPVRGARPTTGWLPGEVVVDSYDVTVHADAPPGQYVIEIGLYNAATGERLEVRDQDGNRLWADRILLGTVQVVSPTVGR
ncbi:MAG: glycosyltransferase family 39 protein [Anaerolineae bacterium]|nr:glycosyltransferase family 39 protein [Anaerolineae bacterium]